MCFDFGKGTPKWVILEELSPAGAGTPKQGSGTPKAHGFSSKSARRFDGSGTDSYVAGTLYSEVVRQQYSFPKHAKQIFLTFQGWFLEVKLTAVKMAITQGPMLELPQQKGPAPALLLRNGVTGGRLICGTWIFTWQNQP
jgi:hypothetical protein